MNIRDKITKTDNLKQIYTSASDVWKQLELLKNNTCKFKWTFNKVNNRLNTAQEKNNIQENE